LHRNENGNGYTAQTSAGPIGARNVVIATGPYQRPIIPALLSDCDLLQVHASAYKEPGQLPAGAVLIVGSGASGAQIAEELTRVGRQVYLSVGRHRRMPRRYRGRDLIWWLAEMGLDRTPIEQRGPDATLPLITGAYGGHTIDFREFATQGMTLLGHLQGMKDGMLTFAGDLFDTLAQGDAAYSTFLDKVDAYVAQTKMNVPVDLAARTRLPDPLCVMDPLRQLDWRRAGLGSVIWATGYTSDYSWIDLPVLNERGEPTHRGGVADVPGIYFLGLPWLSKMNSSFLSGVGDDAAKLAEHICGAMRVADPT